MFSGGFGIDTAGAFSGTAKNLSGIGALGKAAKGGGMFIDPFSAIMGVAGIGTSLFGASQAQQAQQDALAQQVAGANFAAQQQTNARALQTAQGLLGMQFGELIAAPRELERQKEAQLFQYGPLAGIRRAGESEDWRRAMDRATSGPSKEAARFANRQALKQSLAQAQGAMRGMFGPIAPIDVESMFV